MKQVVELQLGRTKPIRPVSLNMHMTVEPPEQIIMPGEYLPTPVPSTERRGMSVMLSFDQPWPKQVQRMVIGGPKMLAVVISVRGSRGGLHWQYRHTRMAVTGTGTVGADRVYLELQACYKHRSRTPMGRFTFTRAYMRVMQRRAKRRLAR